MSRRLPAVVLALAAMVAIIAVGRTRIEADVPTFSVSASGWMPFAPEVTGLTETWFCPGVQATGEEGIGGELLIANRSDSQMVGTVQLISNRDTITTLPLVVAAYSSATLDVDATLAGEIVSAMVEIEGGGAVVEQRAIHPDGNSLTACSNSTSDVWYLADGFTVEGSLNQVILTNPYEQTVVADLGFATREGSRSPASYQGIAVPAQSVRVIDLGAPGAGAQGEPILAIKVEATRGRLVVGRSQQFAGGGRAGTVISLAAPALRDQWWFADGAKGAGTSERFSIYNPTDDAVEVDPIFVGVDQQVQVEPIEVPPRQVVTFEPGTLADLPEGRHVVVFSTLAEPSIVVERAITRTVGDDVNTSVLLGATPRQDGYVATRWYLAAGPEQPTTEALVIYNADNTPGTISISAVGTSGPVPVPSLQDIDVAAAALLTIDLTDPLVIGRELIIDSDNRLFVERSFPTGRGDTRSAAWAVPAG